MDNSDNIKEKYSKKYYNTIPINYCKNCLSLKILTLNDEVNYCDECGCTDTNSTDIESWRKMFEEKYGKPF